MSRENTREKPDHCSSARENRNTGLPHAHLQRETLTSFALGRRKRLRLFTEIPKNAVYSVCKRLQTFANVCKNVSEFVCNRFVCRFVCIDLTDLSSIHCKKIHRSDGISVPDARRTRARWCQTRAARAPDARRTRAGRAPDGARRARRARHAR